MLKLVNLSTFKYDTDRFNDDRNKIIDFLKRHRLDGVELLYSLYLNEKVIPREKVKGVHLRYYPAWIDFWRGNSKELLKQFGNVEEIKKYYGGLDREIIINSYRQEIMAADRIGAEYAVFHVSHVELEHIYNYKFSYSDNDILEATIELLNEVFKGLNTNIKLLFENLWWPGLTMLDKNIALKLVEGVSYENKGFMMDTGHLMNTNISLQNEEQAVDYMLNTLNNLGELKKLIKGVHLSCSLSGTYVIENVLNKKHLADELTYDKMNENIYNHITNIDMHRPFTDKCTRKLIDYIEPDYLVYEFITNSLSQLEEYIKTQDRVVF